MYEEKLGVKHFDLAIDFGCLYILTKPLLYALAYTKDLVGNMGLGILLITLLIKLLLFPLANKSYRSMNRMSALQPKIQELRKKYEGDNVKLGQAVSEIYKKEKVNPVGGCLPILIQSPVLFALYKVLYISIEMRQAPFIWWISDLSQADPLSVLNLFGLLPINLPAFLQVGIWPLLMGITMLLQQKMSPAPADPSQEKMMLIMPIMFTFMFAQLPSGLVIYWTFSNILGIIQQYIIKKLDEKYKTKARAKKS
jgi:YidC/Oxa1 family membrane protein insertase